MILRTRNEKLKRRVKQKSKPVTKKKPVRNINRKTSTQPSKKKAPRFKRVIIRRTDATKQKVRKERHPLYNEIYDLQDEKRKAKKKGDVGLYRKLTNKILHLREQITHKNLELGVKKKPKPDLEKIRKEAEDDLAKDYILEPSTPYTKWEAMEHFDKNKWLAKVKWFIIGNHRLPSTDMKNVEIEALDLWEAVGSNTVFAISFNPKSGTFKYEIY